MTEHSIVDRLMKLRPFLASLEDPATTYEGRGVDLKPETISAVRREIEYLEECLARTRQDRT